jgi:N-acetylglucosaminyldiphosphoundecaprenol N-acetyl-beta-D-mannosaminyltransferase
MSARPRKKAFGLLLSADSARDIACAAIRQRPDDEVALVVTPNIDHIATIRRLLALAHAYRHAARIVCDGWPVQLLPGAPELSSEIGTIQSYHYYTEI